MCSLNRKTIAQLKELFQADQLDEKDILKLKEDERIGVQKLINAYENKLKRQKVLENMFLTMSKYEQYNYSKGHKYIAGIDEAGRGPLAGPVVAASVILPEDFKLLGLTDSKLLNESTRNNFFEYIKENAISYGIATISSEEIDRLNIYEATKLAMRNSLQMLNQKPDHVLIDAVFLDDLSCSSEVITKGDQKSITIAAASILAKVARDRLMKQLHNDYPLYDFNSNKGYGTKHHINMLRKHGVSSHHRKSFTPVKNAMN